MDETQTQEKAEWFNDGIPDILDFCSRYTKKAPKRPRPKVTMEI